MDFDGDALNFTVIPDYEYAKGLEKLSVIYSAFDLTGPRRVSGNVAFPKTVMATVSNYVHSFKPTDEHKLTKMSQLLIN